MEKPPQAIRANDAVAERMSTIDGSQSVRVACNVSSRSSMPARIPTRT
jgi:hypothetical protein